MLVNAISLLPTHMMLSVILTRRCASCPSVTRTQLFPRRLGRFHVLGTPHAQPIGSDHKRFLKAARAGRTSSIVLWGAPGCHKVFSPTLCFLEHKPDLCPQASSTFAFKDLLATTSCATHWRRSQARSLKRRAGRTDGSVSWGPHRLVRLPRCECSCALLMDSDQLWRRYSHELNPARYVNPFNEATIPRVHSHFKKCAVLVSDIATPKYWHAHDRSTSS
jgi:hypothetical protein